jgi:hypothetical protein
MGQMKCFPVRKATDQDGAIWLIGGGPDPAQVRSRTELDALEKSQAEAYASIDYLFPSKEEEVEFLLRMGLSALKPSLR